MPTANVTFETGRLYWTMHRNTFTGAGGEHGPHNDRVRRMDLIFERSIGIHAGHAMPAKPVVGGQHPRTPTLASRAIDDSADVFSLFPLLLRSRVAVRMGHAMR
jgi:hypothetical protein